MKTKIIIGLAIIALPIRAATPLSGIAFNEIMYALPGSDGGREWIELKNFGSEPITVVGGGVREEGAWKLIISTGDNQETYRLASQALIGSLTIKPGGYLIIAVDAPTFLNENPLFPEAVVDCCGQSSSSRPLRDTAALLQLKNGRGEIVAEAYYSNLLGAWENGKTLEFDGADWREGLREKGTPGQENSVVGLVLAAAPSPPPQKLTSQTSLKEPPTAPSTNFYPGLIISEFLPNPRGDDREGEWIEIANLGTTAMALEGLKLKTDATKKLHDLTGTLPAGGYKLIKRSESGLLLRNTNGTIELLNELGHRLFEISYRDTIPEGWSGARFGDSIWKITRKPTPGQANLLDEKDGALEVAPLIKERGSSTGPFSNPASYGSPSSGTSISAILAAGLLLGLLAAVLVIFLKRRMM